MGSWIYYRCSSQWVTASATTDSWNLFMFAVYIYVCITIYLGWIHLSVDARFVLFIYLFYLLGKSNDNTWKTGVRGVVWVGAAVDARTIILCTSTLFVFVLCVGRGGTFMSLFTRIGRIVWLQMTNIIFLYLYMVIKRIWKILRLIIIWNMISPLYLFSLCVTWIFFSCGKVQESIWLE